MMQTRLRWIELGFLVALGAGLSPAAAQPAASRVSTGSVTAVSEPPLNYIYLVDPNHTNMAGDTNDIQRVRQLVHGNEPLLWFRDGGHEYIIRDPALLKQLDAVWKPINDLGEAQGKLGTRQGELGSQQGALGAQQGLLGARQGTLSVREAALSMRADSGDLSPADRADITRQRRGLRHQRHAIDKQMHELTRQMQTLGEQMTELSRQMSVLGQRMEAASHKAEADLRALLRQAVASGAAMPVK